MVSEEVVKKAMESANQMALSIESESRMQGRHHYKSRFLFLKEKILKDQFHSDTFFPWGNTDKGEKCSQLCIGSDKNYKYVHPMKR